MKNRITREKLAALPYGEALVREFDLCIAANIHDQLHTRQPLSGDLLSQRVASFCAPLDLGLDEKFLGIIQIPDLGGEPRWQVHERLLKDLALQPRGHWAIYELNGGYSSWVSNGIGGTLSVSGDKFQFNSPDHPALSFYNVRGMIYAYAVAKRRAEIEAEIIAHSLHVRNLQPGARFKDAFIKSSNWTNVVYIGAAPQQDDDPEPAHIIRCSRRGVKTKEFAISDRQLFGLAQVYALMPSAYCDRGNPKRLKSLQEIREARAQARWDLLIDPALTSDYRDLIHKNFALMDETIFASFASKASFRTSGDTLHRNAYVCDPKENPSHPTYTYSATFGPNSCELLSCSITRNQS